VSALSQGGTPALQKTSEIIVQNFKKTVKKNLYLFSKQNLSQFLKIKCFPKKKFFLRTI